MNRPTTIETWALRDDMRALLTRRPQTGSAVFAQLRDNWGRLGERRMWRTIRWLVDRGFAIGLGQRGFGMGYVAGFAPEHPSDYGDRRRLDLFRQKRCYECENKLESTRPWWCGPRCLDCYNTVQCSGHQRRREACKAAQICVRCRVASADVPFAHCRGCLDGAEWRKAA